MLYPTMKANVSRSPIGAAANVHDLISITSIMNNATVNFYGKLKHAVNIVLHCKKIRVVIA